MITLFLGFANGLSSARAEQIDVAKHCEYACGCIPCGCASIRCDQQEKSSYTFQPVEATNAPAADAVKANQ